MLTSPFKFGRDIKIRRQNSTTAEEVARVQLGLFPNPSWLMSGRTSGHQNLSSIFPGLDSCLEANSRYKPVV